MRALLLSLLALLTTWCPGQGWYRYQDLPLNTAPREAAANDAGTVYLLTRESRILRKPLGGSWASISPSGMVSPECISADPVSGHVYVGTARQGLFRSADQGGSWQLFWLETGPVTGFHEGYTCLTQSHTSGVFFGGHFGTPRITRFTNNGSVGVIRTITSNPNASPSAIHYSQAGDLYVGTHLGIWVSHDQGESFTQTGLATGLVYDLAEGADGDLYALHEDLGTGATSLRRSSNGIDWEAVPTPAEQLTSIHFDPATGQLWLGTRQGLHTRLEGVADWTALAQDNAPYRVVQVIDDRNGGLLAFSDPYTVQQFNSGGNTWSSATDGLVGTADRLVFGPTNTLYAFSHFGSSLVSQVAAGTDLWEYALLESAVVGVKEVWPRTNGQLFASTIRSLHRSGDGGLSFMPTDLPPPYAGLTTGYIDLFVATEEALYVQHTALSGLLFTSVDDGVSWTVASDITAFGPGARFVQLAKTSSGTLYVLQNGPHTDNLPKLFSSADNGATWTLVPHDYADFINSFDQHELEVMGDRLFLVGPRKVYEVLEGAPPVIQDLGFTIISSNDPLLTFKVDGEGRYIVRTYLSGVYRHNGTGWDLLGLPTTVLPGAPPLGSVERYDDLPFVIIGAGNGQGIAPGIYCYLDAPVGVEEAGARGGARVFPNPTAGQVTVHARSPVRLAELLDASGRAVRTLPLGTGSTLHFDLQDRPAGPYLLRVTTDEGVEVHRLLRP